MFEGHLDRVGRVRPNHQHLPVGHVDDPKQSEGDRQAQSGQEQDAAQAQTME